jgi:hypothetical protein
METPLPDHNTLETVAVQDLPLLVVIRMESPDSTLSLLTRAPQDPFLSLRGEASIFDFVLIVVIMMLLSPILPIMSTKKGEKTRPFLIFFSVSDHRTLE